MNSRFHLIFLITTICLLGCEEPVSSGVYTATNIEGPGASAEEIRDVILSISPDVPLAVIEDGRAVIDHRGPVKEYRKALDGSGEKWPVDFEVSPPIENTGKLPPAPKQKEEIQTRWELDSAAGRRLGISAQEIATRLRDLMTEDNEPATKGLHGKFIETKSGDKVPLDSLVKSTTVTVTRQVVLINGKGG